MKVDVRDSDAIQGVRPRLAFAPSTVDECGEVMAMAAREQLRLGFIGGGTAQGLGAAPTALDAVVRTERLARIVEHVPADMVVVVEAGCTLAALQAALGTHGQRLALDPPSPERATIGGLVATAAFGPLRARYGAVRDLIIGVTLVGASGEVARGGGKVVKNVAGFDLPKVACGSLGTLGLIAAAAFRLHPVPEVTTTVLAGGLTAEAVVALVAAARAAQLEPASVVALTAAAAGRFDVGWRFEGFGHGVEQQVARMVELARAPASGASAEILDDAGAAAFWRRHDAVRAAAPLRVRVAGLPLRFPSIAALVAGLGDIVWYANLGLGFAGGGLGFAGGGVGVAGGGVGVAGGGLGVAGGAVGVASGGVGVAGGGPGVAGVAVADVARAVATVTAARAALVSEGGSLVVETAPAELRAAIDPWGPRPPSFAIMERLKRRFDPDGRLNPGRFVGGL